MRVNTGNIPKQILCYQPTGKDQSDVQQRDRWKIWNHNGL